MSSIINGEVNTLIDCNDRGLQYGDGLFETIAVKNNRLLLWREHLNRLAHGCETLGLPVVSETQWLSDIKALNISSPNTVIKLILTRGTGGRGYRPAESPNISRMVSIHALPSYPTHYYSQGINVLFCKTRVSINSTLAGIKHLNRLENVLARNEWCDESIYEGFMLDDNDHVIEGTMSNIFAVNNNVLYTPLLNQSGVKGVVRQNIIKLAQTLGFEVNETLLNKDTLLNMDEIFITNSLIGVCPVHEINGQYFKHDEVTSSLMDKLDMTVGSQEI